MEIKHNVYFDGQVQSIGLVDSDGKTTMTVGLVLPGTYDFGTAGPKETIRITTGAISFNGQLYTPHGEICVIEPEGEIKVVAEEPSSYVCTYG